MKKNPQLKLHYGDLTDSSNLTRILSEVKPEEVYNLGAQSHVAVSFEAPEYTAGVDATGKLRLLEADPLFGLEKTKDHAVLSGLHLGALRIGAGNTADRDHALPPS